MRNAMRLLPLITVAVAVLCAAPALAFHDGGVADCQGCHTMHNSQNNASMNNPAGSGGPQKALGFGYPDLLLYANASDVCLRCHGGARSYNVFTTDPLAPAPRDYYSAGNFVFLLEDNINDGHNGGANPILGEGSGHNIQSGLKGVTWDSVLSKPPAANGTSQLSNNQLHCSSCHDPHGNDSFRLLYLSGQDVSVGGDTIIYGGTMEADGIGYGDVEADNFHNAYKSGYSEWCNTCHQGFHAAYGTNLIHPSGTFLTGGVIAKYNKYEGTTDCVANDGYPTGEAGGSPCGSGLSADAYLADVPFEDASNTTTRITGPTGTSKVACVTCHRPHATSARDAGRWDFQVTLLDEDGDESLSWPIPRNTANGTYTDANQRSLCNKCHSQDEYDHVTP